jgi:hypothetical protein
MHPLRKLAAPVKYRKHMGMGLGAEMLLGDSVMKKNDTVAHFEIKDD